MCLAPGPQFLHLYALRPCVKVEEFRGRGVPRQSNLLWKMTRACTNNSAQSPERVPEPGLSANRKSSTNRAINSRTWRFDGPLPDRVRELP